MEEDTFTISLRLPVSMVLELEEEADRFGVSVSEVAQRRLAAGGDLKHLMGSTPDLGE